MARALVLAALWLAATGRPLVLSDAGPHLHYGWGEPIRLRHLYATSAHGLSHCFLRIRTDGTVDCERSQSAHSECGPPGPPPRPPGATSCAHFPCPPHSPLADTPNWRTSAGRSEPGSPAPTCCRAPARGSPL